MGFFSFLFFLGGKETLPWKQELLSPPVDRELGMASAGVQ